MDDVFGNCSSETIMEADLSKMLANINQDIADLQYLELQLPPEVMESQLVRANSCMSTTGQHKIQRNTQVSSSTNSISGQHQPQNRQVNSVNQMHCRTGHVDHPLLKSSTATPSLTTFMPKGDDNHFRVPTATPRNTVAHVPVITSIGKRQTDGPKPQPRNLVETSLKGVSLRHTQSAVVDKRPVDHSVRPRAQSTGGTTTHTHFQQIQYRVEYHNLDFHREQSSHGYVNLNPSSRHLPQKEQGQVSRPLSQYDNMPSSGGHLPPASTMQLPPQSAPPVMQSNAVFSQMSNVATNPVRMPQYVNIPNHNYVPASPMQKLARIIENSGSNSAPSTPRGGGGAAAPSRFHHSYIELWAGTKEERDSLSDSECEELKRSFQEPQTPLGPSPGYVEMSSPYIKSPQVASPFNGSVLADLATKLASYAGHQPRNIFCPFCPRYFGYEKSLGSHIHKQHREQLNSMVDSKPGDVKIQFCPICEARFFDTNVLPKHLIDFHRSSVIEILEKNKCILSDVTGIQCPFCIKKVPHGNTGEQVMLYHLQQLHLGDFENMVRTKFQPYSGSDGQQYAKSLSSTDVSEVIAFHPGITSTPGLSSKLSTMNILSASAQRNMDALNLDATWSSHRGLKRSPMPAPALPAKIDNKTEETAENKRQLPTSASKGILRNKTELTRRPSVKRELRFSVPPVTSEEVFIPESPEQSTPERSVEHQQQNNYNQLQQLENQKKEVTGAKIQRSIPIRIDSLSSADFMDMNEKNGGQRKRRRLGLGIRSRKAFKKRDKENISERDLSLLKSGSNKFMGNSKKFITEKSHTNEPSPTQNVRTFRRPKPVPVPRVPELMPPPSTTPNCHGMEEMMQVSYDHRTVGKNEEMADVSPFTHLKLYSPLRMFRCNGCRVKFCDNESLSGHISSKHRGLLHILRPQYGCGVCSARFYENKYLVKHCLQHHTSLLEIRSPGKQKISLYRISQA